jgi:hypothetical protein
VGILEKSLPESFTYSLKLDKRREQKEREKSVEGEMTSIIFNKTKMWKK